MGIPVTRKGGKKILILLYKGQTVKPVYQQITISRKKRHSMGFQIPIASMDVYKGSFFPQTIKDWNALPNSLIFYAEVAEDCVAKFTSLMRVKD